MLNRNLLLDLELGSNVSILLTFVHPHLSTQLQSISLWFDSSGWGPDHKSSYVVWTRR